MAPNIGADGGINYDFVDLHLQKYIGITKMGDEKEIQEGRKYIHQTLIDNGVSKNFSSLSTNVLDEIFELYDQVFFGGQIKRKIKSEGHILKLQFTEGSRTKLGGWCKTQRSGKVCHYTLSFPIGLYTRLFTGGEKKLTLGGLSCSDRLMCLQMVFEHELVHLLMQLYGYESKVVTGPDKNIYSPHGKLFKCVLHFYFGHTEIKHNLLGVSEEKQLAKEDVNVGDKVKINMKGEIKEGYITKKNPVRAVVALDDGRKISAPYNLLMRVGNKSEKEILKEMMESSVLENRPITYKEFKEYAKKELDREPKMGKAKVLEKSAKYEYKIMTRQEENILKEIVKSKLKSDGTLPPSLTIKKTKELIKKRTGRKEISLPKERMGEIIRDMIESISDACVDELYSTKNYKIYLYTPQSMVILGEKDDLYDLKRSIDAFVGGPKLHAFVRQQLKQCPQLDPPGIIFPLKYLEDVKKLM